MCKKGTKEEFGEYLADRVRRIAFDCQLWGAKKCDKCSCQFPRVYRVCPFCSKEHPVDEKTLKYEELLKKTDAQRICAKIQ